MQCLASCEFLINNVSFPEYFIRKKGQRYLNTWHGTPIKLSLYTSPSPRDGATSRMAGWGWKK
ncbi:CDP-glycerol glycerophosphotransferase family protein, partial [Escherichia coli]|uniref:CDP-glycerol glycerophosphotransferase family protein n=1 Tax=Escherichia coli TaxID=562 RepID=UPI002F92BAB8